MRFKNLYSVGALLFGCSIVLISLARASAAAALTVTTPALSASEMYVGDIGPDHVLFPFVSVKEKAQLSFLEPADKAELHLQIAAERSMHVGRLIKEDHGAMAVATLLKVQNHILSAINLCQQNECNSALRDSITNAHIEAANLAKNSQAQLPSHVQGEIADILAVYQATQPE